MEELLNALCMPSIKKALENDEEKYVKLPLKDWLSNLRESRHESAVLDVDAVEEYLSGIKEDTGEDSIEANDIRKHIPKIDGILKHITCPPNNLQQAIAQMTYNLLHKYTRQILVLPCGSGKSRIAATIALFLLELDKKIKKVHMVFVNEILMRKDQEDFKDLWELIPQGSRIDYHSNLDFEPGPNSVILYDESDHWIFSDPAAFLKFNKR